jgi:sugar phosphate isomerase/epimerase
LAKEHHNAYERALKLARKLDVDRVITFSGCPGADAKATSAAWIVSPWPPDFAQSLEWQWKERVIPYWKDAIKLAKNNGIKKVALEMHPNFVVYNPETLLKLRNAVGPEIGCNFDPSHLFWQGADVGAAIRSVGDAIFHFHAKDCKLDHRNIARLMDGGTTPNGLPYVVMELVIGQPIDRYCDEKNLGVRERAQLFLSKILQH